MAALLGDRCGRRLLLQGKDGHAGKEPAEGSAAKGSGFDPFPGLAEADVLDPKEGTVSMLLAERTTNTNVQGG
jgi:hypothetical protein